MHRHDSKAASLRHAPRACICASGSLLSAQAHQRLRLRCPSTHLYLTSRSERHADRRALQARPRGCGSGGRSTRQAAAGKWTRRWRCRSSPAGKLAPGSHTLAKVRGLGFCGSLTASRTWGRMLRKHLTPADLLMSHCMQLADLGSRVCDV